MKDNCVDDPQKGALSSSLYTPKDHSSRPRHTPVCYYKGSRIHKSSIMTAVQTRHASIPTSLIWCVAGPRPPGRQPKRIKGLQ